MVKCVMEPSRPTVANLPKRCISARRTSGVLTFDWIICKPERDKNVHALHKQVIHQIMDGKMGKNAQHADGQCVGPGVARVRTAAHHEDYTR